MNNIKDNAHVVLSKMYGKGSAFREGQYEAIEATLTNNRTLVVQKTGWGKSLVYFICTKLLRNAGKGLTFVVSPLLVLMANQIEAANRCELKCEMLNGTTKSRHNEIIDAMKNDKLDLVLITPETLFSAAMQEAIKDLKIGLFVIDEAHCISDWGHDFRLEYGNLKKVIKTLPRMVPILATTATANDRVVEDLVAQLGGDVFVSRGPLARESLHIKVLKLKDKADRYAWILKNISALPGTGIIYCLTQRDCDYLADYLNTNGINVRSYYSRGKEQEHLNEEALALFSANQIKAIVATIKLGMGYDKGDIAFVIHFQKPSNIVSYYQQIGRAGRSIEKAYAILLAGEEDDRITNYFIDSAFPSKKSFEKVYEVIENNNGSSLPFLTSRVNLKRNVVAKILAFLCNENAISKQSTKYYLSPTKYSYPQAKYEVITAIRKSELRQMANLIHTKQCYSKLVVNSLDDFTAVDCGKCSNCVDIEEFCDTLTLQERTNAVSYLKGLNIPIEPRKMWAQTSFTPATKIEFINETGWCLCKYGDPGYGELVKEGKYTTKSFCDELVGASASLLSKCKNQSDACVTSVPSLRSDIVKDFAQRLAETLKLPYVELLQKTEASPQKSMENSSYQCYNAQKSFSIVDCAQVPKNVILVDDMIDSKWTLTVCGYILMEHGAEAVVPFALADSSQKENE